MRRQGTYSSPAYEDPNDRRMVRIIRHARRAIPRAVNILGVPFDGAVLGRRGAAGGPAAIRQAMSGFSNYSIELGIGLEGARVFDIGDIVVDPDDVLKAHSEIEGEVGRDLEGSSLLAVLGGDNSISLPALRAYSGKFDKIGLVVIDSHLDLRGSIEGRPTSGSSYGLAIEALPGLDPKRVVEIGSHDFLNSRKYVEKAEELGVQIFTARDVWKMGPRAIAKEAFARAGRGVREVYLSVDMDAVDLAHVSGVSAPSTGGVSYWELYQLVHNLARNPEVKCADLVELAPSLDPTGKSQVVAANALMYMIAGFQSRGRRPRQRPGSG